MNNSKKEYIKQYRKERKHEVYLKPNNNALFKGYVKANEISQSKALNEIVKEFFNQLPYNQKVYYLNCNNCNSNTEEL